MARVIILEFEFAKAAKSTGTIRTNYLFEYIMPRAGNTPAFVSAFE